MPRKVKSLRTTKSTKKDEDCHVRVEHKLNEDIMYHICKYLRVQDLRILAQVCKMWRFAALREERRRSCIQELLLPVKINSVITTFDRTPLVSLLVYDPLFENLMFPPALTGTVLDLLYNYDVQVLNNYKRQLPNKTIVLKVQEYFTTDDQEFQDAKKSDTADSGAKNTKNPNAKMTKEQKMLKLVQSRSVLGFLFSNSYQRVRVRATWFNIREYYNWNNLKPSDFFDYMAKELGVNDLDYPTSTIISFAPIRIKKQSEVHELDKRAKQSGKKITWANVYVLNLSAYDRHKDNPYYMDSQTTAFIIISGPSVESWSTYIHYFEKRDAIERKLHHLKAQVKRKRHYTGLFYSPKCLIPNCDHKNHPCGDSRGMMRTVKRIFPDIRFTGLFVYWKECLADYNIGDTTSDYMKLLHPFASILIISYD